MIALPGTVDLEPATRMLLRWPLRTGHSLAGGPSRCQETCIRLYILPGLWPGRRVRCYEVAPPTDGRGTMSLTVSFRELSKLTPAERGRLLVRSEAELGTVMEKAKPIIAAVKAEGDEALARFAREFDKSPVTADRLK